MKTKKFVRTIGLAGLVFVFVLNGCKKNDDEITISGRIYDNGFGQYLQGVTVRLSGNGVQNGVYSPEFITLETVTSDASGNFSFTRKKDKTDSFRITVTKDQYFTTTHEFSSSVFSSADTYSKEIQVDPQGYLTIRLHNAFPSDNDDQVVFYFTNSGLDCYDCCTNIPHTGTGPAFDTTFTCCFYGNRNIAFMRSVTKDQQTNLYIDTLFCPAFTTTTYDIPY